MTQFCPQIIKTFTKNSLLETASQIYLPQTFQVPLDLSIHKNQLAVLPVHVLTTVSFHILASQPETRNISGHLANWSEWHTKMWFILLSKLKDAQQSLSIFLGMGVGNVVDIAGDIPTCFRLLEAQKLY